MSTRVVTVTIPKDSDETGSNSTTVKTARCIQRKSSYSYLVCDDPNNHSPFVNPTAAERFPTDDCGAADSKITKVDTRENGNGLLQKLLDQRKNDWNWPSRWTTPRWILQSIALMDQLLVSWWLMIALDAWDRYVPLQVKRKLCFWAWHYYVAVHTLVVCRWMGGYKDDRFYRQSRSRLRSLEAVQNAEGSCEEFVSDEYKAYSTLCYPSQFFVVDVPRIRFALSQLNVVSLRDVPSDDTLERVSDDRACEEGEIASIVPDSQREHQVVRGVYVTNPNPRRGQGKQSKNENDNNNNNNNNNNSNKTTRTVLFWFYGGAYLGGDAEGNLAAANEFMEDCNADAVFIPEYRLAPEAMIDDCLWDVAWAYRYLLRRLLLEQECAGGGDDHDQNKNKNKNIGTTTTTTTTNIVFVGISSGGALALRLLQLLRDRSANEPVHPSLLEPILGDLCSLTQRTGVKVAGSVFFAPYVDYREPQPPHGSFLQNSKYDWVVTQGIQDAGLPYLDQFIPPMGDDLLAQGTDGSNSNNSSSNSRVVYNAHGRSHYSPLTHDMTGLPPLCLIVSEHEACYDMTIEIANKARQTGKVTNSPPTDVTVGVWKHMCHVFSMVQGLLPEANASMDFAKAWVRSKTVITAAATDGMDAGGNEMDGLKD